jgi:hypothetical protein
MFGNPAQIKRAITSAVPDCDKLLKRRAALSGEVDKVSKGRERLLSLIVKGVLSDEQAESQLAELQAREATLRQELDRLAVTLANMPSEEQINVYVDQVGSSILLYDDTGDGEYAGGNSLGTWLTMTAADKRRLVDAVFSRPLPDGTPSGVYVAVNPDWKGRYRKRWLYTIRGQMEFEAVLGAVKPGRKGGAEDLSVRSDHRKRSVRGTAPWD